MADEQTRRVLEEIQAQLARGLSRAGVSGQLEVTLDQAVLHLGSQQRRAPLRALPRLWPQLKPKQRAIRLRALQQELTPLLRRSLPPPRRTWVGLFAVVVLTAAVSFMLLKGIWRAQSEASAAREQATSGSDGTARARRVCEATRSRVMRGGTVGPVDAEGWLFELRLVRSRSSPILEETEKIEEFLKFSKRNDTERSTATLTWPQAPPGLLREPNGVIFAEEERRESSLDTRLTFSGDYVRSYFTEHERIDWIRFASALSRHLNATHGALYARCAHLDTHHVGGWFAGQTPAAAADTLVYFMSGFVDSAQLSPDLTHEDGQIRPPAAVLAALSAHSTTTKKAELSTWLSEDGGMLAGSDAAPTAITFPFKDSNRASRASRRLARRFGVSIER